jgi:hypothetical protein
MNLNGGGRFSVTSCIRYESEEGNLPDLRDRNVLVLFTEKDLGFIAGADKKRRPKACKYFREIRK